MPEQYFCTRCLKLTVTLDATDNSICERCGGKAIAMSEIQAALNRLPKLPQAHTTKEIKTGWLFSYQGFECYVSFLEAKTVEAALEIASDGLHPWYCHEATSGIVKTESRSEEITRNQWCDWVKERA